MKKPSISASLIILGSCLLFVFSVVFSIIIDVRTIPFNDVIPMIVLYSGWSALGIGLGHNIYVKIRK